MTDYTNTIKQVKKSCLNISIIGESLPMTINYEGQTYLLKSTKQKKLHVSKIYTEKIVDKKQ